MEMKKIVYALLFAAALFAAISVSTVMAHEGQDYARAHAHTHSPAPAPAPAPAPGPGGAANDASASLPVLGSVVGASIASFIVYCMQ